MWLIIQEIARAQAKKASVAIPGKSARSANSFRIASFSNVTMRSMMPNSESMSAPRLRDTDESSGFVSGSRIRRTGDDGREIGSLLLISVHVVHFLMPNAPAVPSRAPEGTTRDLSLRHTLTPHRYTLSLPHA